jgi:toxin FitB
MFADDFAERILPLDSAAARAFAPIVAHPRRLGHPISAFAAQIAAIAHSHGATLATRNIEDFADSGVKVISPWSRKRRATERRRFSDDCVGAAATPGIRTAQAILT